jgi:hypothetical protein
MKFEKEKILVFYKRLISLYPQSFRERFGESMEQTFRDVCNEQAKGKLSLGFIVSIFAETSVGVISENLTGGTWMNYWLKNISIAALFGLFFIGAFVSLSMLEKPEEISESFERQPVVLILFYNWLLFTLILTPIVSGLRSSDSTSIKDWLLPFGAAVFFGLLFVAPFAFMEWFNNPRIQSGEFGFPFVLFLALWISPVLFFLTATPIVRSWRAGESILAHPISLILRVAFLLFLAITWILFIRSEMSCFLGGVPGCD